MKYSIQLKKAAASMLCITTALFGSAGIMSALPNSSAVITAAAAETKIDKTSRRFFATYNNTRLDYPKTRLDAKKVFKELKYTKEMFAGHYYSSVPITSHENDESERKKFYSSHKKIDFYSYKSLSAMPIAVQGNAFSADNKNGARVYFADEKGYTQIVKAKDISINGHKITFEFEEVSKSQNIKSLTYDFEWSGGKYTLSANGETMEYCSDFFTNKDYDAVFSKAAGMLDRLDNIKEIRIRSGKSPYFYITDTNNDLHENVVGYFGEDGLFNFSYTNGDGKVFAYEYVYFMCDTDAMILTDGKKTYTYSDRASGNGKTNLKQKGEALKDSDNNITDYALYNNLEEHTASTHINAKDIYKKLEYTPEMFYGIYKNPQCYSDPTTTSAVPEKLQEIEASSDFMDIISMGDKYTVTTLPTYMIAGKHSMYDSERMGSIGSYHWMTLGFIKQKSEYSKTVYEVSIKGSYYINGNKLVFTPLEKCEYNSDRTAVEEYSFAKKSIEFEFEFEGGKLTLKNGKNKTTLKANAFLERSKFLISYRGFLSWKDSIDGIIGFGTMLNKDTDNKRLIKKFSIYTPTDSEWTNYNTDDGAVARFGDDGIVRISCTDKNGNPKAYELVYFFCGDDGYVFADGKKTYYYNYNYNEFEMGPFFATSDDQAMEKLDEEKIAVIAEKKNNLQDELKASFKKAGIKVESNDDTGEMMLDSSVLFAVDKYELSSDGQKFLNKFMKAYSSVILKDDYEGFVSKIMVEGHTDSTGERKHNEELSQKRAEEVLKYCLSDKTKIDSNVRNDMKKLMEAVGYANDYPILDKSGKENAEKSRRVSFRFVIDVDNASKLEVPKEDTDTPAEE